MPAPDTLLKHARDEVDRHEERIADAREARDTARAAREAARTELRALTEAVSDGQVEADRIRSLLAAIPTPADGDALVAELTERLLVLRRDTARAHAARWALAEATVAYDSASRTLDRARNRLAAARSERSEAEARAERLAGWKDRLAEPPLSQVSARAEELRTGDHDARKNELESAIPKALRTSGLKRRELEEEQGGAARALEAAAEGREHEAAAGLDGMRGGVASRRAAYRRAWDTLAAYAGRAVDQVAAAEAFLAEEMPEIPEGQRDRLEELGSEGATAAEHEIDVTEARLEVVRKRQALEAAKLERIADPDADPSEVEDAAAALEEAEEKLEEAWDAFFEEDDRARTLQEWRLALPDPVWRHFLRFHEVTETLKRLEDADPADLVQALTDAEAALAEALHEEAEARERRNDLTERRLQEAGRRRAQDDTLRARTLSAVRGDTARENGG